MGGGMAGVLLKAGLPVTVQPQSSANKPFETP